MNLDPTLQGFISLVFRAALEALVPIVLALIGLALTRAITFIKSKVSAADLARAKAIIDLLVMSAEQSGLTGQLESDGAAKKEWVVEQAIKQFTERGLLKFAEDVPFVEQIIESAVYELKNITLPPLFEPTEVITTLPAAVPKEYKLG